MATTERRTLKSAARNKTSVRKNSDKGQSKRKKAIEKAILFWKEHAVTLSSFKFDRQQANAR